MNRGEHVVFDEALRQDDGVFVVVPFPWHEGHEQVLAQCQVTVVGRRTVSEQGALLNLLTFVNTNLLVDTGVLVRAVELGQDVGLLAQGLANAVFLTRLVVHDDLRAVDFNDGSVTLGQDQVTSVTSGVGLNARPNIGSFSNNKRNSLLLHVGTHEGTVGVVVLDEGDECG